MYRGHFLFTLLAAGIISPKLRDMVRKSNTTSVHFIMAVHIDPVNRSTFDGRSKEGGSHLEAYSESPRF